MTLFKFEYVSVHCDKNTCELGHCTEAYIDLQQKVDRTVAAGTTQVSAKFYTSRNSVLAKVVATTSKIALNSTDIYPTP